MINRGTNLLVTAMVVIVILLFAFSPIHTMNFESASWAAMLIFMIKAVGSIYAWIDNSNAQRAVGTLKNYQANTLL